MKKTLSLFLLCIFVCTLLQGCTNNKKIQNFLSEEAGNNANLDAVVEKYGSVSIASVVQYPTTGEYDSYCTYLTADSCVIAVDKGATYLFWQDVWYQGNNSSGTYDFAKLVSFGDASFDPSQYYTVQGFSFTDEDEDITFKKNKDGTFSWKCTFPWVNSDDGNEGTAHTDILLNADYEIVYQKTIYLDGDGNNIITSIEIRNLGEEHTEPLSSLLTKLASAGETTRHVTYHVVQDGAIVETFEADVPTGFYCAATFPSQYCNEDGSVSLFENIECTKEVTSSNAISNTAVYLRATPNT